MLGIGGLDDLSPRERRHGAAPVNYGLKGLVDPCIEVGLRWVGDGPGGTTQQLKRRGQDVQKRLAVVVVIGDASDEGEAVRGGVIGGMENEGTV